MRNLIIAAILLTGITACTSPYGNYAKISDAYNERMADDTAHELATLYPPAATHLTLSQDTKDAYGVELVKKLRETGYAIESGGSFDGLFAPLAATPTDSGSHTELRTKSSAPLPATPEVSAGASGYTLSIGYIVDHLGEGLYRVTINIGVKSLSRVYRVSGNGIAPAGVWTRKE